MRGEVASSRKWGWRCRGWERSKGHTLAREIGRGAERLVAVRRLGKFLRDHRLLGCGAGRGAIRRGRPWRPGGLESPPRPRRRTEEHTAGHPSPAHFVFPP